MQAQPLITPSPASTMAATDGGILPAGGSLPGTTALAEFRASLAAAVNAAADLPSATPVSATVSKSAATVPACSGDGGKPRASRVAAAPDPTIPAIASPIATPPAVAVPPAVAILSLAATVPGLPTAATASGQPDRPAPVAATRANLTPPGMLPPEPSADTEPPVPAAPPALQAPPEMTMPPPVHAASWAAPSAAATLGIRRSVPRLPATDTTIAAPAASALKPTAGMAPTSLPAATTSQPVDAAGATVLTPLEPPVNAAPLPSATAAPVMHAASGGEAASQTAGPATQLAPALVAFSATAAGGQRMTLHLTPAELGSVQIRIDRSGDAPAKVEVSVERSETLTLLLRDQSQLQHTLDRAGVPPEGRILSFHLADPVTRGDPPTFGNGGQPNGGQPDGGQAEGSLSLSSQGGEHRGNGGSNGPPAGTAAGPAGTAANGEDAASGQAEPLRWHRAGVDITA